MLNCGERSVQKKGEEIALHFLLQRLNKKNVILNSEQCSNFKGWLGGALNKLFLFIYCLGGSIFLDR